MGTVTEGHSFFILARSVLIASGLLLVAKCRRVSWFERISTLDNDLWIWGLFLFGLPNDKARALGMIAKQAEARS